MGAAGRVQFKTRARRMSRETIPNVELSLFGDVEWQARTEARPMPKTPKSKVFGNLSIKEVHLIGLFRKLSERQRGALLDYLAQRLDSVPARLRQLGLDPDTTSELLRRLQP